MGACTKSEVVIAIILMVSLAVTSSIVVQLANAISVGGGVDDIRGSKGVGGGVDDIRGSKAPIATSGNNAYVAWSSNKTGNDEVMFKASTDGGKTFADKMNLSNSTNSESQDVQIAASGSNVYISWWERNSTSNEPELRVSNDNGKTFGEKIMLSAK